MQRVQTHQSIKEMDQKELAEALPRLREEALKAEEALRVAQERLHEADQRMAKILTFVRSPRRSASARSQGIGQDD